MVHVPSKPLAAPLARRSRDAPEEGATRLARNTRFSRLRAACTIVSRRELAQAGHQLVDDLVASVIAAASKCCMRCQCEPRQ